ncbi:hypothetical protein KZX50_01215 [Bacillus infantis]|uniref:YkyB family protein n=1 Tax=Bacillus infantis TaxID=324767 RepID=UPI000B9A30D1|nr:YkyB family protein [Bacillus infantis]MCK6204070.1 hypothetical protein [Bacillus infantis]OXT16518.1 hypothetical protein B9K06_15325 [Bacillus sp. OG2]
MNSDKSQTPRLHSTVENLSQAIFTVNRHAKTATNPKFLYKLKHEAILKLIKNGDARKIGLHYSGNPRYSQQQSDVLVECGSYTFHIPPAKKDFEDLPHLGKLDSAVRNPKTRLPLGQAKKLLSSYTGLKEESENQQNDKKKKYQKPVFKKLGESY